jgi:hypothetical protein
MLIFSSAFALSTRSIIMLIRSTAFLCALAAVTMARAGDVGQVNLSEMQPGSRFEISTADLVYRGELINPATGEAHLAASRNGTQFSEPQTVFLLGATQGRTAEAGGLMLVKMNQLQTGLCVELGLGSLQEADRYLTAPIQSLHMETD